MNANSLASNSFLLLLLFLLLVNCSDPNSSDNQIIRTFNIIVADATAENNGAIISVDPTTGEQSLISTDGFFLSGPADVCIGENNTIYTAVFDNPAIVKVDPDSGTQTLISSAGYLKRSIRGIAIDNNKNLLVTKGSIQYDLTPRLLSINPLTGEQEVVTEGGKINNIYDVKVSESGEIYVSAQIIDSIHFKTAAIFKINESNGEQTEIFKSLDGALTEINQFDFDKKGNIYAIGREKDTRFQTIIHINPANGNYNVVVPAEDVIYYAAIACAENGDVFVIQQFRYSSKNSFHRVNIDNGTLESFSGNGLLSLPTGMDILYTN